MASVYPVSADSIDDAGATLEGAPLHEDLHNDMRDAIAALQSTVGVLTESNLVFRHASAAARNLLVPSPPEGMVCFTQDDESLWVYADSDWRLINGPASVIQELANVEDTGSNIGLATSTVTTIYTGTVTLPTGWNSMDLEVCGVVSLTGEITASFIEVVIGGDQRQAIQFTAENSIETVPIAATSAAAVTSNTTVVVRADISAVLATSSVTTRNIYVRKTRVS